MTQKQKFTTRQEFAQFLNYDPTSGEFTRLDDGSNPLNRHGTISLEGNFYFGRRVAWTFLHGRMPTFTLKNLDGDPLNNAAHNLGKHRAGYQPTHNGRPHIRPHEYISTVPRISGMSIYLRKLWRAAIYNQPPPLIPDLQGVIKVFDLDQFREMYLKDSAAPLHVSSATRLQVYHNSIYVDGCNIYAAYKRGMISYRRMLLQLHQAFMLANSRVVVLMT